MGFERLSKSNPSPNLKETIVTNFKDSIHNFCSCNNSFLVQHEKNQAIRQSRYF